MLTTLLPNGINLALTRTDLIDLAMAVSDAAVAAYHDDRLETSVTEHLLAARLWRLAAYEGMAKNHAALARAIRAEAAETRAQAIADDLEDNEHPTD